MKYQTFVVRSCSAGRVSRSARRPCCTRSFRLPEDTHKRAYAACSIKHTSEKLDEIKGTDVGDVRSVTYSPGRCPCVSPDRCGPTASARRSTWPYSRSSWLRGRSGRCAAPCPAVHKHGTEVITYSAEHAALTRTHQSPYSHHILR